MPSPNLNHPYHYQLAREQRITRTPLSPPRRSTETNIPSSTSTQQLPIFQNPPPPLDPSLPISFDGQEWFADEGFPWSRPVTETPWYRHRYSASAPNIASKADDLWHPRPSTPAPYPWHPSPLTLPPIPPVPIPHVPVPYPLTIEPATSSTASAESTPTLTMESQVTFSKRRRLKKKRRSIAHEEGHLKLFAQMGAFFTRHKFRREEGPTPNRLVIDCHFIAKDIPPSFDDAGSENRTRYGPRYI